MFVCGRRHLYERFYQMAELIDFAANYIDRNEEKRLVSPRWCRLRSISSPPLQWISQEEDTRNRRENTGSLCMILLFFEEDRELDAEGMDICFLLPN